MKGIADSIGFGVLSGRPHQSFSRPTHLQLGESLYEVHCLFATARSRLVGVAPTATAISLMAGNTGFQLY